MDQGGAAVVRSFIDALERRDAAPLREVLAHDVVFEPMSTAAATRRPCFGPTAVCDYVEDLDRTWRSFEISLRHVEEVGDGYVIGAGRIRARAREISLLADNPVGVAFRVRDGRVAWGRVFATVAEAHDAVTQRRGAAWPG